VKQAAIPTPQSRTAKSPWSAPAHAPDRSQQHPTKEPPLRKFPSSSLASFRLPYFPPFNEPSTLYSPLRAHCFKVRRLDAAFLTAK